MQRGTADEEVESFLASIIRIRVPKINLRVQHDPHASRSNLGTVSTNYAIINTSVNPKQTVLAQLYREDTPPHHHAQLLMVTHLLLNLVNSKMTVCTKFTSQL